MKCARGVIDSGVPDLGSNPQHLSILAAMPAIVDTGPLVAFFDRIIHAPRPGELVAGFRLRGLIGRVLGDERFLEHLPGLGHVANFVLPSSAGKRR
jgi:hypothetical protein